MPVIATHREKDGLTNMFMELRKQYPNIVRDPESARADREPGGGWRMVSARPAAARPRAQAEGICDELRRAGYARCAVRPNKP